MEPRPSAPPRPPTDAVIDALLRSGEAVLQGTAPDTGHRLSRLPVRRVMRPAPLSVGPEMSVAAVAQRMRALDVDCLPVVESGRLIGVVRRRDLEAALELRSAMLVADYAGEPEGSSGSGM